MFKTLPHPTNNTTSLCSNKQHCQHIFRFLPTTISIHFQDSSILLDLYTSQSSGIFLKEFCEWDTGEPRGNAMGILPLLGGIQGSRPALGGEATKPYQKIPKCQLEETKSSSKPSSSDSMLILSGVYNPANITFIFHYSLHASSRRSAKHSNVHSSSDHRGVDIGSICSTPWRSVTPLHRRWRKPRRVSKNGVGSKKAMISCPKIRENHQNLWIFLAFLRLWGFTPGKSSKASNKWDRAELFLQQVDSPTAKKINEGPLIGENLGANSERELLEGSSHLVSV